MFIIIFYQIKDVNLENKGNMKLWFDFENAPHIWVLKEIINYFEEKGYKAILTAKDFSYTIQLSSYCGFRPTLIGEGAYE